MINSKHIKLLPIKPLLWFLLGASAAVQAAIMAYRHLAGIHLINDAVTLWASIILGSLVGAVAGLLLAIPDAYAIHQLNKFLRWGEKTLLRVCIQLLLAMLIALVISTLMTLLSELIFGYDEPLLGVVVRNGLIFPVVNILLMAILEGWLFFRENRQSKERAEALSHELLELRFEVLKNQVDPHFIFNSLNVLSALIDSNPDKAQRFVEEFSDLQRYVLDTIEKPVVTLAQELKFVKSYIFLQQIRHGEAIILSDFIPKEMYEAHIPPFSLQIVAENAVKHNAADACNPLKIELAYANGYVEVRNNVQAPVSSKPSTGLGQSNLMKRYELISNALPVFEKMKDEYVARLPLVEVE